MPDFTLYAIAHTGTQLKLLQTSAFDLSVHRQQEGPHMLLSIGQIAGSDNLEWMGNLQGAQTLRIFRDGQAAPIVEEPIDNRQITIWQAPRGFQVLIQPQNANDTLEPAAGSEQSVSSAGNWIIESALEIGIGWRAMLSAGLLD